MMVMMMFYNDIGNGGGDDDIDNYSGVDDADVSDRYGEFPV